MNQQREGRERVEVDLIEIAENARLMMHNRGTLEVGAQDRLLPPPLPSFSLRLFNATRGKRDVFAVHDDDKEDG